jgi:hypothetical protein
MKIQIIGRERKKGFYSIDDWFSDGKRKEGIGEL